MLSQRMAKAICFIELGHEIPMHHKILEQDAKTFDDTLHILRDGGGEHNLEAEHDRRILAKLELLFSDWKPFAEEIKTVIATDEVSSEMEEHIIDENLSILRDMNEAVSMIEQEYANPHTLDMANAVTLNIIARQRMLAQKAAKDFCYVATSHSVEEERADLTATRNLFAASLGAVINGYEPLGIAPPPSEEIRLQLEIVAEIWDPMSEIFKHVSDGSVPTDEEVTFIAIQSTHLQDAMNEAVQMYVVH